MDCNIKKNVLKWYKRNKTELLLAIAIIMIISIWIGLAPQFYSWFCNKQDNGLLVKRLFTILDGIWLANIPICFIFGYIAICCYKRILKDNDIRVFRPLLALLGLLILCPFFIDDYDKKVVYAKIIWNVDYRMILAFLLGFALIVMIYKLYKKHKQNKADNQTIDSFTSKSNLPIKGFSLDEIDNNEIPDTLKKYASVISEKLMATQVKKQSYSVGVTGEWGVGKTKFLELLKDILKDKAEIVEFNPWMCHSPEQVTRDFFDTLRHQLSPKYSRLSKSIKDYAKHVNSVAFSPFMKLSINTKMPTGEESLFSRKKSLSEKFERLPRPVVIIIDDIDRLEREEVFEVLRLVRNTADLKNTIYLVAYDKEYVTNVLKGKKINNGSSYLEKIFNVEVYLPKVEDSLIWNTLKVEIQTQDDINGKFADALFKVFTYDDRELILRVLNSYRRAKRFSRLYMLHLSYLSVKCKREIKRLDMFWLELLQIYDKKTYDKLAEDPSLLLYVDEERYRMKANITQDRLIQEWKKYEGAKFWKEETPKILMRMFGDNIELKEKSICYIENYDKYFTLSVSPFKLSFSEMQELFNEGGNPDEVVNKWVNSKKYTSSIIYQFKHVNVNSLQENGLKSYLYGILRFSILLVSYHNNGIWEIKKLLYKERFNSNKYEIAQEIVLTWLQNEINKDDKLLDLSRLLNRLYVTRFYNECNELDEFHQLVIDNNQLESLQKKVMKKFLDNHPDITAIDVMKIGTEMSKIFKNCCMMVEDKTRRENYAVYKQVAFDEVINHFSKKREKPTLEKYDEVYGNLFSSPLANFSPQEEEDYYSELFEEKMEQYFGSSYNNKLEEFKRKCFVRSKQ